SGNHFLFRLFGVEAITVVPAGTDMAAAMQRVAAELQAVGRRGYVIPGGGSNALGGLGYAACAQEMQQQGFEQGLRFDHVVVGSGSSGTHGGLLAGFVGNHIATPMRCIGGYWQPKYSVPNARMVEAVQMLARTEAILLDPVYTGKVMAGLIGLARDGELRAGERVLFIHTGGMPSVFAYERVLLGQQDVAP